MTNDYSRTWFETFLHSIPAAQTRLEVAFLERWLPNPPYERVLDLCCGTGRHAGGLAGSGHRVTGVDASSHALADARRRWGDAVEFLEADMRGLDGMPAVFDALICLRQSFGHFDARTNADILRQVRAKLVPRGRFVLDIYHRSFFEKNVGVRRVEKDGVVIQETKSMSANRLTVRLEFGDGRHIDTFEWQLFTPEELRECAERSGLRCLVTCTGFDEAKPASAEQPRMQGVFERV